MSDHFGRWPGQPWGRQAQADPEVEASAADIWEPRSEQDKGLWGAGFLPPSKPLHLGNRSREMGF